MAEQHKTVRKTASLAGASIGTGLVGLGNHFPEPWKSIVVYAAPSAAVIAGILWNWGTALLLNALGTWQINRGLDQARKIRDAVFRDANASAPHKQRAQQNVENLEQLAMIAINDSTKSIRLRLVGSTQNPTE